MEYTTDLTAMGYTFKIIALISNLTGSQHAVSQSTDQG